MPCACGWRTPPWPLATGQLEAAGVEAVLINTHYLAEQVENYLQERPPTVMKVQTSYERELLGTAGTAGPPSLFRGRFGITYSCR